jgi:predicted ArsR family transcriptional regulator
MTYCLFDGKTEINPYHLEAAVAFWDYCEQSARFIFHGRSQDTVANKILAALESGAMTGTEMHRLFKNNLTKTRLETALAELIASGQVEKRERKTGKRGRPINEFRKKENPDELNEQNELKAGQKAKTSFISLNSLNSSRSCQNRSSEKQEQNIIEVTI